MLRPISVAAALLLSCTAFAQGSGLKPSTELGKPPAAKPDPAPASRPVEAPAAAPAEQDPRVAALEAIFTCISSGLTADWRSATVEVTELSNSGKEREFQANFTYARTLDSTPQPLVPCEKTGPARNVHALNEFLEPEKRQWKRASLTFFSDGKFELKYDYAE